MIKYIGNNINREYTINSITIKFLVTFFLELIYYAYFNYVKVRYIITIEAPKRFCPRATETFATALIKGTP